MRRALFVVALSSLVISGCDSRVDPEQGRHYACDPASGDPGQCPGGWICGLEKFCRDPAQTGEWLCESTADCPQVEGQLWHCGFPNGFDNPMRCYDRLVPKVMDCRYGAEVDDCHPEWKCGVDSRCHDATPKAYACHSDDDCTGGWRCAVDGVCRDTREQALRPSLPVGHLVRERINPQLPASLVDFEFNGYTGTYVGAYDGGIAWATADPFGVRRADGGLSFASRADLAVFPSPSAVQLEYRASDGEQVPYVATGDRLKDYYDAFSPEGRARVLAEIPVDARLRKPGNSSDGPLVAYSSNSLALFDFDTEASSAPFSVADGGVPLTINAVDYVETAGCSSCGDSLYAATTAGLFYAPRATGWPAEDGTQQSLPQFRPVHSAAYPNAYCPGGEGAGGVLGIRHEWSEEAVAIAVQLADGGVDIVSGGLARSVKPPEASCADLGLTDVMSCPACPIGGVLKDFHIGEVFVDNGFAVATYSLCEMMPIFGANPRWRMYSTRREGATSCEFQERSLPWGDGPVQVSRASHEDEAFYLDGSGRPWACSFDALSCYPYVLGARQPKIIGDVGDRWFMMLGVPYAWTDYQGNVRYSAEGYRFEPGVGFVTMLRDYYFYLNTDIVGGVSRGDELFMAVEFRHFLGGNPREVVVRRASDLNTPYSRFAQVWPDPPPVRLEVAPDMPLALPDRPTFQAALARTSDGGTAMVVAGRDRLWAGDVTAQMNSADAGTAVLPIRSAPSPFIAIDQLALLDTPAGSAHFLTAYVTAQQRVFEVVAQSESRYVSREITVPGEPVGVFADGDRGRVGLKSGDVYSLPFPVLLARGPLAPGDRDAQAFGAYCGDIFAVGTRGVYRVDAQEGETIGAWQKLDLSRDGQLPAEAYSFQGSTFHRTEDALLLITGRGDVIRLAYETCPR